MIDASAPGAPCQGGRRRSVAPRKGPQRSSRGPAASRPLSSAGAAGGPRTSWGGSGCSGAGLSPAAPSWPSAAGHLRGAPGERSPWSSARGCAPRSMPGAPFEAAAAIAGTLVIPPKLRGAAASPRAARPGRRGAGGVWVLVWAALYWGHCARWSHTASSPHREGKGAVSTPTPGADKAPRVGSCQGEAGRARPRPVSMLSSQLLSRTESVVNGTI